MAKRARKRTQKKVKTRRRKAVKKASSKSLHSYWKAYRDLQSRVDKAWAKLQADVRRKASPNVLIRNKNQLLLLLGECNYMARECMRLDAKTKKRSR